MQGFFVFLFLFHFLFLYLCVRTHSHTQPASPQVMHRWEKAAGPGALFPGTHTTFRQKPQLHQRGRICGCARVSTARPPSPRRLGQERRRSGDCKSTQIAAPARAVALLCSRAGEPSSRSWMNNAWSGREAGSPEPRVKPPFSRTTTPFPSEALTGPLPRLRQAGGSPQRGGQL